MPHQNVTYYNVLHKHVGKEIKALIEVGTSLGYSGEELKRFLTEERMRLDKVRESQEKEKERQEKRNK